MNRRRFLRTLSAGFAAVPLVADAQKITRVGILWISTRVALTERHAAFVHGLRDLGWVNGQNFFLEARFADGRADRLPELARDLVTRPVDVVVAPSAQTVIVLRQVTTTLPVVMANVHDPVGLGFVKSLARPGGNVTGLATLTVELGSKNLALLREVLPRLSSLAVLVNPANPAARPFVSEVQTTAKGLGVKVVTFEAQTPKDIDQVLAEATRLRVEALLVSTTEGLFFAQQRLVADFAIRHRLPLVFAAPADYVDTGALLGYGSSSVAMFREAARYVDRILKGAKPADLPVERPTKFELAINLRTAKAIGLTIPPSLLSRADRVIE